MPIFLNQSTIKIVHLYGSRLNAKPNIYFMKKINYNTRTYIHKSGRVMVRLRWNKTKSEAIIDLYDLITFSFKHFDAIAFSISAYSGLLPVAPISADMAPPALVPSVMMRSASPSICLSKWRRYLFPANHLFCSSTKARRCSHSFVICLLATNNRWPLDLIHDALPFSDVM